MNKTFFGSLVVFICLPFILRAADDSSPENAISLPKAEISPAAGQIIHAHGLLGTETLQYPTPVENRPNLSQNNQAEVTLKVDFENSWAAGSFSVQGAKSANLNSQYLAVQEAFAGTPGPIGVDFGRKINFWNQADEDWNLGLWQPLQMEDGLRPIPQGLMGLFYHYDSSAVQILAYGSPIFIPTMEPERIERDGALVSDSRWVHPLPQSVALAQFRRGPAGLQSGVRQNEASPTVHETQLIYHLSIPNSRDLVLRPGFGVRARVGATDRGPWASAAYAHKPINALGVKFDASLLANSQSMGQIDVSPVVINHEIWSADVGWNFERARLGLSLIQDLPETLPVQNTTNAAGFPTDYYQQQPRPVQVVAWHLSSGGDVPWIHRELNWKLLYLRAHTEATSDYDSQGINRSSLLPYRLIFTNAASLEGELKISSRWTTRLKYLREFDQLGSIWSFVGEYRPTAQWTLKFGADLLGVDDEKAQEGDSRFINAFRENDRIYGGLAYAF